MKTNDIVEAERNTKVARTVSSVLKHFGYKKLGSGADSTIWSKDAGSVIKIIMPETEGSAAVRTFKRFVDFCKQHSNLSNLPKFYDIESTIADKLNLSGDRYMAIAMERLYPIKMNSFEEAMIWLLSDLAPKHASWEQAKKAILDKEEWKYWQGTNTPDSIMHQFKNLNKAEKANYHLLYSLMKLLYDTGIVNKMGWDLHTANVMQRKDGTLVIIDPWFALAGTSVS